MKWNWEDKNLNILLFHFPTISALSSVLSNTFVHSLSTKAEISGLIMAISTFINYLIQGLIFPCRCVSYLRGAHMEEKEYEEEEEEEEEVEGKRRKEEEEEEGGRQKRRRRKKEEEEEEESRRMERCSRNRRRRRNKKRRRRRRTRRRRRKKWKGRCRGINTQSMKDEFNNLAWKEKKGAESYQEKNKENL